MDTHPLLRLALPLVAGIAIGDCCQTFLQGFSTVFLMVAAVFIVVAISVAASRGRASGKSLPFLYVMTGAMLCIGVFLDLVSVERLRFDWADSELNYRVVIVDTPKEGNKVWQTTVEIEGGEADGKLVRVALMKTDSASHAVSLPHTMQNSGSQKMMVGDALILHTRIQTPRNTGNPSEFDFAKWLQGQGISGSAFCFASQWKKSEIPANDLSFKIWLLRWRDTLVAQYADYFQGRELGVLAAMTLGDKSHLDATTRDIFSHTGVSHVLALSGFHLSVLFSIYQLLVLSLCRRRRLFVPMSILGVCGLWIFALLAGLPLSLVRAAVMFSIVQLMGCLRRDSFSVNNLALAAILLLLASPQSLFDVGFQLSFLSVFSIILFSKSIPRPQLLQRFHVVGWFYDLFVVSLCAQLGTAPLVAYYFHTFPVYGWISNFVAVPLAYVVLGVGMLFFLLPFARSVLVVLLGGSLHAMDASLSALSELPGAILELYPTLLTVVLTYVSLYFVIAYLIRHKASRLYCLAGTLVIMFSVEMYVHRPNRLTPQLIFYNVRSVPVVHALVAPDRSYLWSTKKSRADSALVSVKRTFWKEENIKAPKWMTEKMQEREIYYDGRVIVFGGIRVALLTDWLPRGRVKHPLSVDYLLVAKGARQSMNEVLTYYAPRCVVLDANLGEHYRRRFLKELQGKEIEVYDMAQSGALKVEVR